MRIAFLCPSISRTSGGIFEIERNLAHALARLPLTTVKVFGPADEHTETDLPLWLPLEPRFFRYLGPASFRFSSELRREFLTADLDLAHLHALWVHNSIVVRQWAQRWKRPYLITSNGMLEPWAIQNARWKKRVALALYERASLNGAACIQVNSEAEYRSIREFGLRNPVCIIPNGVDLPDFENDGLEATDQASSWAKLIPPGRKSILYLGRLHPKKGLVNLLKAWAKAIGRTGLQEWTLAIAGWDQANHCRELTNLASELRVLSSVVFLGPQFDRAKKACYANCDAFILPSFSEGLPMTVLEAWSYGKPVLMTPGCNLPEGFAAQAALEIEPHVGSIALGLRRLFEMSSCERRTMGVRGLALVQSRFSWSRVATDMRSVYEWILGAGSQPDCVMLD